MFIIGVIPITFETSIQNNEVIGTISRKSYIPPFNQITTTINSLDSAYYYCPKTSNFGKIVLKSTNEKLKYLSLYGQDEEKLAKEINKSIKEQKRFKKAFRKPTIMCIGFMNIFISFIIFFSYFILPFFNKTYNIKAIKITKKNKPFYALFLYTAIVSYFSFFICIFSTFFFNIIMILTIICFTLIAISIFIKQKKEQQNTSIQEDYQDINDSIIK